MLRVHKISLKESDLIGLANDESNTYIYISRYTGDTKGVGQTKPCACWSNQTKNCIWYLLLTLSPPWIRENLFCFKLMFYKLYRLFKKKIVATKKILNTNTKQNKVIVK